MKKIKLIYYTCLVYIAGCFSAWADTAVVTQILDYGQIVLSRPTSSTTIYLRNDDSASSSTATIRNSKTARILYTNTDSGQKNVSISGGQALSLTCTDSSTCGSCGNGSGIPISSINYGSKNKIKIPGNSSDTFQYFDAQVSIPANCGTGLFTGTIPALTFTAQGNSISASLPIRLEILSEFRTISVSHSQDLNFGSMFASTAHNVTIDYNGNRSGNSNYLLNDSSNPPAAGEFIITNEDSTDRTVQITLPSNAVLS